MTRHAENVKELSPEVRSQYLATRHVRSELTNDPDLILTTITPVEPLVTAIIEQRPEGQQLTILTTVAQQRHHYEESRAGMAALDAEIYTSIGSDWYAFLHGTMTVRKFASDELRRNEWIGLFPISPDVEAIGGEIGLSWPPCAKRGDETGVPSSARTGTTSRFDAWLAALQSADADAVGDCYEPDALAATRPIGDIAPVGLRGAAEINSYYAGMFTTFGIDSVEVVKRVVDRWFVFAELSWVLRDHDQARVSRRTAHAIVMTDSDRIAIDLGWATDEVVGRRGNS